MCAGYRQLGLQLSDEGLEGPKLFAGSMQVHRLSSLRCSRGTADSGRRDPLPSVQALHCWYTLLTSYLGGLGAFMVSATTLQGSSGFLVGQVVGPKSHSRSIWQPYLVHVLAEAVVT